MSRPSPRSERRAAWREANRIRGVSVARDDHGRVVEVVGRQPRSAWKPLPIPPPVAAHLRATGGRANHQTTLEVSLGFNRAQRRAMHSKKGSRRLMEHGRPTSTPAQSFAFGPKWNAHAVRIEAFRRLKARTEKFQEKQRRANRIHRRVWRFLVALARRLVRVVTRRLR